MPVTTSIAGAQAPRTGNQEGFLSWASVSQREVTLTIICFSSSQTLEPQNPLFKESLCGNTAYKAEKKQLHCWVLGVGKSRARSASFSTVPLRGPWGTLKALGGSEECVLKTTDPGYFTDEHHRGALRLWGAAGQGWDVCASGLVG